MSDDQLPAPPELGLPTKFSKWRPGQEEAILDALLSDKRFMIQAAPTGSGKSIMYVARAILAGARTAFLTSTKALQDQLANDFGGIGLFDMRGLSNYRCVALEKGGQFYNEAMDKQRRKVRGDRPPTCDEGPCHSGAKCDKLKEGGCYYYDAVKVATHSQLVVTNYQYWMAINRYSEGGLGKFDLLVMDEAHDAPDELADFIKVEIFDWEAEWLGDNLDQHDISREDWVEWALFHFPRAEAELKNLQADVVAMGSLVSNKLLHRTKQQKNLVSKLQELSAATRWRSEDAHTKNAFIVGMQQDWIAERIEPKGDYKSRRNSGGIRFSPIWGTGYAEPYLFCGTKKVLMVSATVRPKTVQYLGLEEGSYDFIEYKTRFPKERRPVTFLRDAPRIDRKTRDDGFREWVRMIDRIIKPRLDRKGLIHAVSYRRAEQILTASNHSEYMLVHNTASTKSTVRTFKEAEPPAILVSPSLSTGWDFPYTDCEYIIIVKIPFIDASSRLNKARAATDPQYANYLAMLSLVQSAGRGMRASDDQCEVFIVDGHADWFLNKNRRFAPKWFNTSITRTGIQPRPLPKLEDPR